MAIKLIDPNQITRVVSISDEAIDRERSNLIEYKKDYDYKKHLKFKEGQQPTLFLLKNILPTKNQEITEGHYVWETPKEEGQKAEMKMKKQGELILKYFSAACETIEQWENGQWIPYTVKVDNFSPGIVMEIGGLVMLRTTISGAEKNV